MFIKKRKKPKNLQVMEALDGRLLFSREDKWMFTNEFLGFTGESKWDDCLIPLSDDVYVINDLLLDDRTSTQIDSLFVTDSAVYLLDVKNFTSSISYRDGAFFSGNSRFENNPIERLERSRLILERILRQNGFQIPVIAKLVFINPDMLLFGHSPDAPILTYPQIKPFISNFGNEKNYYSKKIADFLVSLHQPTSPYERLMAYDYETVTMGIMCPSCRVEMVCKTERSLSCSKCSHQETKRTALLRNMKEFSILFPNRKLSVDDIYLWCNKIISKRTIHTVFATIEIKKN